MTRSVGRSVALSVLLLSVALPVGAAGERLVDLHVRDEPLAAVARAIAEQAGIDLRVHASIRELRVTVHLHQVPVGQAITLLAEVNGLQVGRLDGALLLRRASDQPEASYQPVKEADLPGPPLDRTKVRKVQIHCEHARPSEIAACFGRPGLRVGPGGLTLYEAPAPTFGMAHTSLVATEGEVLPPHLYVQISQAQARFQSRWAGGDPSDPHSLTNAALRMPAGVIAMLGFDPTSTLVIVGEPAAAEAMGELAQQLDAEPQRIGLRVSYLLVPAKALEGTGLAWQDVPTEGSHATLRAAITGDLAALTAAATGGPFETPLLSLGNVQAQVLSFTRVLQPAEAALAPSLVAEGVQSVVATTDLKVVPWVVEQDGKPALALSIQPAWGEVVVDLSQADRTGEINLASRVPCGPALVTVPSGSNVVLAGLTPTGGTAGASALLGQLPFVGALFRQPADGADPVAVVVIIRPE